MGVVVALWNIDGESQPNPPDAADRGSVVVDAAKSLMARIAAVPPETVERYAAAQIVVRNHTLTDPEKRKVSAALEVLTPLHEAILEKHLRSISFADGLPANGQTVRVQDASEPTFDLIFSSTILGETISEFATRKERQLFETGDSTLSVSVVAGSMDAIAFVLTHEATHVVDAVLALTPPPTPGPIPEANQRPFTRGIWNSVIVPADSYRGEFLDKVPLRTGKPLDIENGQALYEELERTPFVSVYSSLVAIEDLAELVAWWQITEEYGQPYRIEIRDNAEVIYSYEPIKSSLVRSRLSQLERFRSQDE